MKAKAPHSSASRSQVSQPQGEEKKRKPSSRTDPARRAKRNADAYTAFVVLGAASTATFLVGTGFTVHSGLRYGKSAGMQAMLRSASMGSDQFFDESGELTREAQSVAHSVPGLFGLLEDIEQEASAENQNIQETIGDMKEDAGNDLKKQRKRLMGSAIAAGTGLVGMLIFISAAKITRHRGIMLHGQDLRPRGRRSTVQAQVSPTFSPQQLGLSFSLRF